MRIERTAIVLLTVLTIVLGYSLGVASFRFGDAAETFDGIEFDLADFSYTRQTTDVDFTIDVSNNGANDLKIVAVDYSFVVNGVLSGGGDARPGAVVPRSDVAPVGLQGRINDRSYVDGLDPSEPISWLVRGRMLIEVDDRVDAVWIGFAFRTETT